MKADLQKTFAGGFLIRFTLLLGIWVGLNGTSPVDLGAGVIATLLAARVSLHVLPPKGSRIQLIPLLLFTWHFLLSSFVAGWDIARRVFRRRIDVQPGFVTWKCEMPPGPSRDALLSISSLVPGTFPVDANAGELVTLHCLDTRQPAVEPMEAIATRWKRIWRASHDG